VVVDWSWIVTGFPIPRNLRATQDRRMPGSNAGWLEKRRAKAWGHGDRGSRMAFEENLEQIRKTQAALPDCDESERNQWLEGVGERRGWEEVHRTLTAESVQKKTEWNQTQQKGDMSTCSAAANREEKDRAIREKQEAKLIADLNRLQQRVAKDR